MSSRGGGGWSATYSKQYGKDRWQGLLNALADHPNQIAFVSPRISHSALRYLSDVGNEKGASGAPGDSSNRGAQASHAGAKWEASAPGGDEGVGLSTETCTTSEIPIGHSFVHTAQDAAFDSRIIDDDHVVEEAREMTYFLDGASALAAYALDARPGEVVLDMCAAPGGKSLIISSMLCSAKIPSYLLGNQSTTCQESSVDDELDEGGLLVCNDASRQRLISGQRRYKVQNVVLTGNAFNSAVQMENASLRTPKACAERQLKMLLIASKLLKKNGVILYTTCSLSHTENEAVIEKFLTKTKVRVKMLPLFDGKWPPQVKLLEKVDSAQDKKLPHSCSFTVEKLVHGYTMLPDVSNFGPMYFCRMQVVGE
ncbi:hypothetical protein ACSSS7_000682 [Eimeria intestinalis]